MVEALVRPLASLHVEKASESEAFLHSTTRVVLDTNVCLDLFVFRDARCASLMAALKDGAIEAVTRDDCRMEWRIVLDYPHLALDSASKAQSAAEFDSLITCVPTLAPSLNHVRLPLCRDADDQKFLELARDARAAVLITKDKALLKLTNKTARAGLFKIVTPDAWSAGKTVE